VGPAVALPVVIFGGEHADVPLEESAGEVVARSIVENRFPAVLDLSLFRKGQMIRFMVAFAETLYRLNREAVHLFVDEADAFAPQARNYGGDENRMLGRWRTSSAAAASGGSAARSSPSGRPS
jgi:hypothetical protein